MADRPLEPLVTFTGARAPDGRDLKGRYVTLRAIDPAADAVALFKATGDPPLWDFLLESHPTSLPAMQELLAAYVARRDQVFYAAVPEGTEAPRGFLSFLRIEPGHGVIEIGNILLGPGLSRTRAGTEAIFLLAREAFDVLGYRRLEWKCNALNASSRAAAERYGFRFEGVFAQHMVVKGHNRDTAWYAILDRDWPRVRAAFEAWLDPANFDAAGRQLTRLRA